MLYLPRLFVYHCDAEPGSKQSETFKVMERRLLKAIINPAMAAAWVLGLWLAWYAGWFSARWLQAKLVLVLLMSAVHGLFVGYVRDFALDRNRRPAKFYRIINEVPTALDDRRSCSWRCSSRSESPHRATRCPAGSRFQKIEKFLPADLRRGTEFPYLRAIPRTQADAADSRPACWVSRCIGQTPESLASRPANTPPSALPVLNVRSQTPFSGLPACGK